MKFSLHVNNPREMWYDTYLTRTKHLLPQRELSLSNIAKIALVGITAIAAAVEGLFHYVKYDLLGQQTPYNKLKENFKSKLSKTPVPFDKYLTLKLYNELIWFGDISSVANWIGSPEELSIIKSIEEEISQMSEEITEPAIAIDFSRNFDSVTREMVKNARRLSQVGRHPLQKKKEKWIERLREFQPQFMQSIDIEKPFDFSFRVGKIPSTFNGKTKEEARVQIAKDLGRNLYIFNEKEYPAIEYQGEEPDMKEKRDNVATKIVEEVLTKLEDKVSEHKVIDMLNLYSQNGLMGAPSKFPNVLAGCNNLCFVADMKNRKNKSLDNWIEKEHPQTIQADFTEEKQEITFSYSGVFTDRSREKAFTGCTLTVTYDFKTDSSTFRLNSFEIPKDLQEEKT